MAQQSIVQKAQASAPQTVEPVRQLRGPPAFTNNVSARIDRVEEGINEICESVNQLTEEFQKLNIRKPVAQSNFNWSYFTPIKLINPQYTSPDSNDDKDNNCQPKTYDELLPKLSPAMQKMCLSRKAQEKKSKKDESEFDGFNLATAEALGWKVDKPSKFVVKGNSEYISKALGWYTNVAITLRDEKDKPIVTIIGNYACIDNSEPKPML
ncbi:hypothetical protein RclHR1_20020005 [Rhizophagus clarus]|uniref:Uncharacterized protein n=1 Tax=Rhizophagus clarus TaxID=94130 RepID=A0A2Z6R427_9GLOM|nr:hypothetical protein RclHR1_20020005 [Rhizophagus clarus]